MFDDIIGKKPDDIIVKIFNKAGGYCIVNRTMKRLIWNGNVYQSELDGFEKYLKSVGIDDVSDWEHKEEDYKIIKD